LALDQLEAAADPGIVVAREDAEHVAVEIRPAGGLDAGDGEAEADHFGTVIGAEDVPAYLADDDQKAEREQLDVIEAPDRLLEMEDVFEFVEREQLPDFDHRFASCH